MENPRILEVGCGTGILTEFLIKKYPNASFEITDISGSMLEECKKRCVSRKSNFLRWMVKNHFKILVYTIWL